MHPIFYIANTSKDVPSRFPLSRRHYNRPSQKALHVSRVRLNVPEITVPAIAFVLFNFLLLATKEARLAIKIRRAPKTALAERLTRKRPIEEVNLASGGSAVFRTWETRFPTEENNIFPAFFVCVSVFVLFVLLFYLTSF